MSRYGDYDTRKPSRSGYDDYSPPPRRHGIGPPAGDYDYDRRGPPPRERDYGGGGRGPPPRRPPPPPGD